MAAHSCCDGAAARSRRRVKLTRRPSSSSSLQKARKQRNAAAGSKASSRKRVAIRRKMESLRRLVVPAPVCGSAGVDGAGERLDELLLHVAGYIMRLQMQVRVMQVMVHALNNPED